jgi:hypothetical protein
MVIGAEHLGQPVRCPHCHQEVMAPLAASGVAPVAQEPAPPGVEPPPPVEIEAGMPFQVPTHLEHEDIFSPVVETSDDLFGGDAVPKIEMPPEPAPPEPPPPATAPPLEPGVPVLELEPTPPSQSPGEMASPFAALGPTRETAAAGDAPLASHGLGQQEFLAAPSPQSWARPPEADRPPRVDAGMADEAPSAYLPTPPIRMPRSNSWVLPLFIVPLISYSILATVAVVLLYQRQQSARDPLEAIPDQGDNKGAVRGKATGGPVRLPSPDSPLPPRLRTTLGKPLALGDLEVTPLKIGRRRIGFRQGKADHVDRAGEDSLALELRLRNVSKDVTFRPLDPFFVRQVKRSMEYPPYTYLEVGSRHFFCGPLSEELRKNLHMVVAGQDLDRELGPGQEFSTFICTDPDEHAVAAVDKASGPCVWRVQVRRGLVAVGGREVPATAVVGVEFRRDEVR